MSSEIPIPAAPAAALALMLFVAVGACSSEGAGAGVWTAADPGVAPSPDHGRIAADPGAASDASEPDLPLGAAGAGLGERLQDFEVPDCDGEMISFSSVLSGAEAVLVNFGAGWCTECIAEAPVLETEIHAIYEPRGLRVMQVLLQDANIAPITRLECRRWRDRFSLSFPVLADTLQETGAIVGDEGVPLNLLVDDEGVIRMRVHGALPEDLGEQIETLLR
jgi:peroxiredoxin